jgi:uridine phosphorylase
MPEHCVLPIYRKVIEALEKQSRLAQIAELRSMMGPLPVFRVEHEGRPVAVAHPGLGGPFVAAFLEEVIALGCRKFIVCGAAGVLDRALARGSVLIPHAAVRDEGTSYHYVPPAREVEADAHVVRIQESVLKAQGVPYRIGKTWSTDALYRETPSSIARRKVEGCLTVEMECAALLSVAKFRGVRLGQFLSSGDDVSGQVWDPRHGNGTQSFPERLFWLSVETCLRL